MAWKGGLQVEVSAVVHIGQEVYPDEIFKRRIERRDD